MSLDAGMAKTLLLISMILLETQILFYLKMMLGLRIWRLKASGLDLCIEVIDTDDRLIIKGWFADDRNKIERIQFADGTVWDKAAIQDLASRPTDTDDYLVGTQYSDGIDGGGGNDTIYGLGGNDVLSGGEGSDYIYGNEGADTIDGGSEDDYLEEALAMICL